MSYEHAERLREIADELDEAALGESGVEQFLGQLIDASRAIRSHVVRSTDPDGDADIRRAVLAFLAVLDEVEPFYRESADGQGDSGVLPGDAEAGAEGVAPRD